VRTLKSTIQGRLKSKNGSTLKSKFEGSLANTNDSILKSNIGLTLNIKDVSQLESKVTEIQKWINAEIQNERTTEVQYVSTPESKVEGQLKSNSGSTLKPQI
jgi:hypothetical protein